MSDEKKTRIESDLIGEREVDNSKLYGVQTLRCLENFNISPFRLCDTKHLLYGMAYTKWGAAEANHDEGLLTDEQYQAIKQACQEILDNKHHDQFPIDMVQGGAGTSTNMNANEVIANRALEIMGHKRGEYQYCSPNDHVNCSQSTNDTFPTALGLGAFSMHLQLLEHLNLFIEALEKKSEEFKDVLKMGRTQLQDAVPMTLGQTFGGFAAILKEEVENLNHAADQMLIINMGATAIGTGICSEPEYVLQCSAALRRITGWNIRTSQHLVGATSDTSHLVGYSSAMKRLCVKLSKMSNDLRLLSSGPRCGFNEIELPARQPGSSIMPGKVNPVIPEVMSQICYKVMGNDVCVTMAGEASQLELNAMEPIMGQCVFESGRYIIRGLDTLREFCIVGIKANKEICYDYIMHSMGIVTALNPVIGYKNSTKIAKKALATGKRVYDLVLEMGILSKEDLDTILAPENMIKPVKLHIKPLHDIPDEEA